MNSKQMLSLLNAQKLIIFIIVFFALVCTSANAQNKQIKIGVLALRGSEEALDRWTPTAEYLSNQIPEHVFVIVPLDFEQIFEAVKNGSVDFTLENSSIYVELEYLYNIDRIATVNSICNGNVNNHFGGVIFTAKNRNDINFLDDLENKKFMAVDETSFGGWVMAKREFMDFGIAPYDDFASMQFGNTHDSVVYAVRKGVVDAGTIRTGILEKMDKEDKIDLNDFKILNQQYPEDFSLLISTRLYPEWPFAKLKHTSNILARQVSIALLSLPPDNEAAKNAGIAGWTIPNNYQSVHICLKELNHSPYEFHGKISMSNFIQQYWKWILLIFISIIVLVAIAIYIIQLYRKLNLTTIELSKSRKSLEQKVKERTSELKRSNNELNLERNKLKVIMDAMDDGLYIVNQQFDIEYINPATEREFGPVKGRKCYNYFHDRTEVCPWCKNIEVFKGKSVHWEWYSEKTKKTYHLFDSPIIYTEGSVSKLEIFHDVTKIVEAQEILQKSEQKYRTLIDGTFDIVTSIDNDGNISSWNRRAEEVFGYSKDEIIGSHASILVPKELIIEQKKVRTIVKETGFVKGFETIRMAKDGTPIPVEMTVSRMDDAKGNMIGLSGILRDIRERKQSEKLLQLNEYRINTRLELLQMTWANEKEILDFSLEKMLSITESKIGYIAFMNEDETVLTMYAYSADVMEECKIVNKPIVYQIANTGLWGEAVRQRKAVITNDYAAPNPFAKGIPKGHVNIVRHMNVPVFDGDKIIMVAGVGNKEETYTDSDANQLTILMSDTWQLILRKRAEDELREHRDHLEELIKERTKDLEAFSYSISHDLRAPLRAVSGFSKMLSDDYKDKLDDEANRLINVINKNALNMNQLITDLLNFSRIGRQQVKVTKIDMKYIASEVFEEQKLLYPNYDLKFKLDDIPSAKGDSNLIHIVLANLISNAVKFSGNEKVSKIEIGSLEKDKQLFYFVKDNGVGFDMKYVDKIWGVFQRLHSPDEFEGTGVGLAIVQKIIQKHGGEVIAEGEVDKGATFYFSLTKK